MSFDAFKVILGYKSLNWGTHTKTIKFLYYLFYVFA